MKPVIRRDIGEAVNEQGAGKHAWATLNFKIWDSAKPTLQSYAGTHSDTSAEITNAGTGAKELLVKAVGGVTVTLTEGAVTFDATAMSAIAEQASDGAVALTVDSVEESTLNAAQQSAVAELDVQAVYDVSLASGTSRISAFNGGTATISVSYALKEGQSAHGVVVWHIADDGTRTRVFATYSGGQVRFTTPHFSYYVIAYDDTACPQDETCPMAKYSDLKLTEWYHDGVHWALENGVMNGGDDGLFHPNGGTTRAEAVLMLWRLAGSPGVSESAQFTDVKDTMWYAPAIRWAASVGIATGYHRDNHRDLVFEPDKRLLREEFAAMLYRYAKLNGQGFTDAWAFPLDYPDASRVEEWAYEPLCWLTKQGVIGGTADGKLDPKGGAARAQVATMLMRYCTEA